MKPGVYGRKRKVSFALSMIMSGMLTASIASADMVPGGTRISNQALVTYLDEGGNSFEVRSNVSEVKVKTIYDLDLEGSLSKQGTATSTVYFPHTLTNTGNVASKYKLHYTRISDQAAAELYLDTTNDGLPDEGSQPIPQKDGYYRIENLPIGQTVNLVTAVKVPDSAEDKDTYEAVLSAFPVDNSSKVENVTSTVNVATGAIFATALTQIHDQENGTVKYEFTVTNTGKSEAKNVEILDFLPKPKSDVALNADQVNTNGFTPSHDPELNIDAKDVQLHGVTLPNYVDHEKVTRIQLGDLAAGQKVKITIDSSYDVLSSEGDYTFDSGTELKNTVYVNYQFENEELTSPSNEVTSVVNQVYGVNVTDINDSEDSIIVDKARAGSTVLFKAKVKNSSSNGDDQFDLSVINSSFPQGTRFEFWNADMSKALQGNRTNVVNRDDEVEVTVKAILSASGVTANSAAYQADLQAVSVGKPEKKDSIKLELGNVADQLYAVDLTYEQGRSDNGSVDLDDPDLSKKQLDTHEWGSNAADTIARANMLVAKPGETQSMPFHVYNLTGESRAFSLTAEGKVSKNVEEDNGKAVDWSYSSKDSLNKQWDVRFTDKSGTAVTSTQLLPSGGSQDLIVHFTPKPMADYTEHHGEFSILAEGAGVNDALKVMVMVDSAGDIALTDNGASTVSPGAKAFYTHQLVNNTNSPQQIVVSAESNQGWSFKLESEDHKVEQKDGKLHVSLGANQRVQFTAMVDSPAGAVKGDEDTLVITADQANKDWTIKAEGLTVSVNDVTTVVDSTIRLIKKAMVLGPLANGQCPKNDGTKTFTENPGAQVGPGECIRWQVTAHNIGAVTAQQVTIDDEASAFTRLEANSAEVTANTGVVIKQDAVSGEVKFNVGAGATADNGGGELKPGEQASVEFNVIVE